MSTRKRKYPETYRTNVERIFIVSEIIKRKYKYCYDINERMWLIENLNLPIKNMLSVIIYFFKMKLY